MQHFVGNHDDRYYYWKTIEPMFHFKFRHGRKQIAQLNITVFTFALKHTSSYNRNKNTQSYQSSIKLGLKGD